MACGCARGAAGLGLTALETNSSGSCYGGQVAHSTERKALCAKYTQSACVTERNALERKALISPSAMRYTERNALT